MSSATKSRVRRFLELRRREQVLVAEAWGRLLVAALRLRLAPQRTLALALREVGGRSAAGDGERSAPDLARAVVRAAAHHLLPMTCLPRALALRQMLRARGIASALRIGVRKENATLSAHAWVEVSGRALGEPEAIEERFRALLPLAGGADREESP